MPGGNEYAGDFPHNKIADRIGEDEGRRELIEARRRADARAAVILAARECPADLLEWGRLHRIPNFAEFTWQAGFLAGMRAAMIVEDADV